jgi:putative protein kinase ArgK-like GTPase of G3E family
MKSVLRMNRPSHSWHFTSSSFSTASSNESTKTSRMNQTVRDTGNGFITDWKIITQIKEENKEHANQNKKNQSDDLRIILPPIDSKVDNKVVYTPRTKITIEELLN